MTRTNIEHVLLAAAVITRETDFVVLDCAGLHASLEAPPPEVLRACDVSLYPQRSPALAALVEGSIGEFSAFHAHYGYYARAADPASAILPHAWEKRLEPLVATQGLVATGWCLERHDLAAAKVAAYRTSDLSFVSTLLEQKLVVIATLGKRLDQLPLPLHRIRELKAWLAGAVAAPAGQGSRDADFRGPEI